MSLLKIGEVAKKTGLTLRALRHYDEIGLLTPSHRSDAGYRLYTRDDLVRLQRIQSLRHLGFGLDDMASLLQAEDDNLADIVNLHQKKMTDQLDQQWVLLRRIRCLSECLEREDKPSAQRLLELLEVVTKFEKYTPEQIAQLVQKRKDICEEQAQKAEQEWQDIFEKFRALYKSEQPASCSEAVALAKRCLVLRDVFTGSDLGDQVLLGNMENNSRVENVSSPLNRNLDAALFAYLLEAVALAEEA